MFAFIGTLIVGLIVGLIARAIKPGDDRHGLDHDHRAGYRRVADRGLCRPRARLVSAWTAGGLDRFGDRRDHPARRVGLRSGNGWPDQSANRRVF